MSTQKKIILLSCWLILLSCGAPSFATTHSMHATLQRIDTVLAKLSPLIQRAASEQDPHARVQIQFKRLRDDIGTIRAGIRQALQQLTRQPRLPAPLYGDYITVPDTTLTTTSSKS